MRSEPLIGDSFAWRDDTAMRSCRVFQRPYHRCADGNDTTPGGVDEMGRGMGNIVGLVEWEERIQFGIARG